MFGFGDGQKRFVKSVDLFNRGVYAFNNQHRGRAYVNFRRATRTDRGRAHDAGSFYRAAASREINDPALAYRFHRRSLEFFKRGLTPFADPAVSRDISRAYAALASLTCDSPERARYVAKSATYAQQAGRAAAARHHATGLPSMVS